MAEIDNRENLDFLEDLEKIGFGACADVYRYDDGNALKVIKEHMLPDYDLDGLNKLVGIQNGICIFPNKLLYVNGKFRGFYLEYTPGKKLIDIIDYIDFKVLFESIKEAEEGLKKLAEEHILFSDYNHGAILFEEENKKFRIVDTEPFIVCKDIGCETIYENNIEQFYSELLMELKLMNGKLNNFLSMDEEYALIYKKYMVSTFTKEKIIPVSEVIKAAIKVFEKEFGKTPRTIAEMNALVDLYNEANGITEVPDNDEDLNARLDSFIQNI